MMQSRYVESEIITAALGAIPPAPVDLMRVASALGVRNVSFEDIRAGFTTFGVAGPSVHVSSSRGHLESRFILAHELAHVMLRLPSVIQSLSYSNGAPVAQNEERFADRVGGALLVPDSWIVRLSHSTPGLDQIVRVARNADVSAELIVKRLALARARIGLLRWRRERGRWAVVARPGVSSQLLGCIAPSFAGQWALENIGPDESDLVVDCHVSRSHIKIVGTGMFDDGDVLQLLHNPSAVAVGDELTEDHFRREIAAALGA